MKKRQGKTNVRNAACVMLVLALLGLVISIQVKSVAMEQKDAANEKKEQIVSYQNEIAQLEKKLEENKAQYALLSDKYDAGLKYLYESNLPYYELYIKYEAEIEKYKLYAGLTAVTGPGIDIGLNDGPNRNDQTAVFIVHDIYINEIINVLRAAGAQAISVNGERIVPMSETLCAGPSIRVNNTKLFTPYHIEAIGDPQALLTAFKSSKIYDIMVKEDLTVYPVIKETIRIEKYNKSYESSIDLLEEYK